MSQVSQTEAERLEAYRGVLVILIAQIRRRGESQSFDLFKQDVGPRDHVLLASVLVAEAWKLLLVEWQDDRPALLQHLFVVLAQSADVPFEMRSEIVPTKKERPH